MDTVFGWESFELTLPEFFNHRMVDENKFRVALSRQITANERPINTQAHVDEAAVQLTEAIQEAIQISTPITRIPPRSKAS